MQTERQVSRPYGERIRQERLRLRLNQTEFARLGGVSKATQVAYEQGSTSPQIEYLNRLFAAGVDTHWITTGEHLGNLDGRNWELMFEITELIEEWASERGKPTSLQEKNGLLRTLYSQFVRDRQIDARQAANVFSLVK